LAGGQFKIDLNVAFRIECELRLAANWINNMAGKEEPPLPPVGAFWIRENEYSAVRKILEDGDQLPTTWIEWEKMAKEMKIGLEAYGHIVDRVYIDTIQFPKWCAEHGTTTGRQGRKMFVAAAIKEKFND
jgi:hypothetical protein